MKDAFEASQAVILSFAKIKHGLFAISTHINEIAVKLKQSGSIFYRYFEAKLNDGNPRYDYLLKKGVTEERIGMYILKKEKIIDIIERTNNKSRTSGK